MGLDTAVGHERDDLDGSGTVRPHRFDFPPDRRARRVARADRPGPGTSATFDDRAARSARRLARPAAFGQWFGGRARADGRFLAGGGGARAPWSRPRTAVTAGPRTPTCATGARWSAGLFPASVALYRVAGFELRRRATSQRRFPADGPRSPSDAGRDVEVRRGTATTCQRCASLLRRIASARHGHRRPPRRAVASPDAAGPRRQVIALRRRRPRRCPARHSPATPSTAT